MSALTHDVLDEIEFEAARTGDHATAAERMVALAEHARPTDLPTRAEILVRAGEQWQFAGDPARAAGLFQDAIDDGGATTIDPRAFLADALFALDRPAAAYDLLAQIGRVEPVELALHNFIAEMLHSYGKLDDAHQWATRGIDLALRDGDPQGWLPSLLRVRYMVRLDLGLGEDDYDHMLDEPPAPRPPLIG